MKSAALIIFIWCVVIIEGMGGYLALIRPDPFWLLMIYTGFHVSLYRGAPLVFLIILAQEALGGPIHGPLLMGALLIYFFIRATRTHFSFEGGAAQVIWVSLFGVFLKTFEQMLCAWHGYPASFSLGIFVFWSFFQAMLSAFLFPFLQNPLKMLGYNPRQRRQRVR